MQYVLRLENDQKLALWSLDAEGHPVDPRQLDSLADVPLITRNDRLIVLLPGQWVNILQVKIPKTHKAELRKAVPFAVEDQLAADVEQLHFALGDFDARGYLSVAVIDQKLLTDWVELLTAHQLYPQVMLPDYLGLALLDRQWSVLIDSGLALVRRGLQQGFVVEACYLAETLRYYIDQADAAEAVPEKLHIFAIDADLPLITPIKKLGLNTDIRIIKQPIMGFGLGKDTVTSGINLLQGTFRQRKKGIRVKRTWRWAVALAAVWVLVLLGGKVGEWWYLQDHVKQLDAQVTKVYRQVYGNTKDVANAKARMSKTISALVKEENIHGFLHIVADVGEVLNRHKTITLEAVNYHQHQLQITVQAKKSSELNKLIQDLQKQGLAVKQNKVLSKKHIVQAVLQVGG